MKKILIVLVTLLALSAMLVAADKVASRKDMPCDNCDQNGMMMGKHDGNGPMPGNKMEMRQDMMKELNLTKEQMKKLEVLKTDHEKIMNTKQAELENLMIDKHIAMKAEKFDQVKAINKSMADIQLYIDNARVDHHAAMLKELTPEQKAKFAEMMPMGKGMGMGKGMHPGMGKGMHPGMGKGKCQGMERNCGGDCK